MKSYQLLSVILLFALMMAGCGKKAPVMFPAQKALQIAAQTPEAKAIITYRNAALAACLEKKVVRSCDSEWVTCRDNAWVVQYLLTAQCPVKSDGRLGMNFVIDGLSGEIISHYPEVEYFADERFCRDDADCLGGKTECLNFIAAPFAHVEETTSPCRCQGGQCILKK